MSDDKKKSFSSLRFELSRTRASCNNTNKKYNNSSSIRFRPCNDTARNVIDLVCDWLTFFFVDWTRCLLCGANDERRMRNLHIFTQVHQREIHCLFFFCHLWKIRKSFFFISICSSPHSTTTFTQSLCDDDLSPGHIIGTLRESSYLCQGRPHATCDDFFSYTFWVSDALTGPKKKLITLCVSRGMGVATMEAKWKMFKK